MKRLTSLLLAVVLLLIFLTSCNGAGEQIVELPRIGDYESDDVTYDRKHLKVGVAPGPYGDMFMEAVYGGEEFAVILPNTDENGACKIAEKILGIVRGLNIPHEKNEVASCVTISIGVTTGVVLHTQSGDDYIQRADEALYMSKQNGRNRYTHKKFKTKEEEQ